MHRTCRGQRRILARSAVEATSFTCDLPWACVSIATPGSRWPTLSDVHRVGLLQIAFDDKQSLAWGSLREHFQERHAHAILDFAQRYWPVIELLLVHCEAGTSRSPAVAAALSQVFLGHEGEFLLPHLYQPNHLVLHTLLDVACQRGLLASEEGPRDRSERGWDR